jgi:mercuric ion transport protein
VDNNKLIVTGVTGAAITVFCSTCGAPLLATVLAALGLSAWLGSIDYMLLAIMVLFLGLARYGLYRQRGEGTGTYPSLRSEERGGGCQGNTRYEERGARIGQYRVLPRNRCPSLPRNVRLCCAMPEACHESRDWVARRRSLVLGWGLPGLARDHQPRLNIKEVQWER